MASPPAATAHVDPVTFEVLRHKFWQVAEEMAAIIVQASSSPVVSEVRDFATAIFNPKGDILAMGSNVIAHVAPMQFAIRAIMDECRDNPGIHEGDAFMVNDPHRGAMHQSDVIIAAPVHYEGAMVAWVSCHCHQLDIGAMIPGGFTIGAREIYQEGLRLPPIKLIEGGAVRKDLWTMLFNHIRVPNVALDFKAQIAANNVGRKRLIEICERYGAEIVTTAMSELMDFSEKHMRERLLELPDGVFKHIDRQDHDGLEPGLHRIMLTLTKRADSITFDFTGSSPQARGFINCAIGGAWAGVFAVLLPWLAYDIPWNAGLLRPVTIIAPEGTICNANLPAPVSKGGVGTMWSIRNACQLTLSKLLGCSDELWPEAMAVWQGASPIPQFSGMNQFGRYFSYLNMDGSAGGCGATARADGMDAAGNQATSSLSIPNIETHEATHPILYAFRRRQVDSPGAGTFRGGSGIEAMVTTYGTDCVELTLSTNGLAVPNAEGIFGGLPACTNYWGIARAESGHRFSAAALPLNVQALQHSIEPLPGGITGLAMRPNDFFYFRCTGGGGYGDPIEREPDRVLGDVADGVYSLDDARNVYGVVLDREGLAVDFPATEGARAGICERRLGLRSGDPQPVKAPDAVRLGRRGEYLEVVNYSGSAALRCRRCRSVLCGAHENPRQHAATEDVSLAELGPLFPDRSRAYCILRRYYCPGCGVQFDVEVAEEHAPVLDDLLVEHSR